MSVALKGHVIMLSVVTLVYTCNYIGTCFMLLELDRRKLMIQMAFRAR